MFALWQELNKFYLFIVNLPKFGFRVTDDSLSMPVLSSQKEAWKGQVASSLNCPTKVLYSCPLGFHWDE